VGERSGGDKRGRGMEEQERGNCFKDREEDRRGICVGWTNEKSGKAIREKGGKDMKGIKEKKMNYCDIIW
jgi:hypothetical protein